MIKKVSDPKIEVKQLKKIVRTTIKSSKQNTMALMPLVGSWFWLNIVIREVGEDERLNLPLLERESRERMENLFY
jgi:hypothetical protein